MLSRSAAKKIGLIIAVLVVVGVLGEALIYHPAPTLGDSDSKTPYFDYIVVIVLENKNLNQVYGASCSGNCSYITKLADSYALAKNYSGVGHGSLPNYLTLTSGGNYSYSPYIWNCYGFVNASCQVSSNNIVDAIEKTGRTWRVYLTNDSGCKGQLPFDYYNDFYHNSTRCSQIVDANPGHHKSWSAIPTRLLSDLNSGTAPNFMWLVPNVCDTGYCVKNSTSIIRASYCGTNSTSFAQCISQTNEYLSLVVPQILSSTIFRNQNAVLFITWDEGGGINGFGGICPQRGQTYPTCIDTIPAILAGPHVKRSYVSDIGLSHYSFVKTLELAWDLASFTSLTAGAVPMTFFFDLSRTNTMTSFIGPTVLGNIGHEWILAKEIYRPESANELSL